MYASNKPRWQRAVAALALAVLAALAACAITAKPAYAAPAPKSITATNILSGKLVLVKGRSYKIGATVSPSNASKKLLYETSNFKVAGIVGNVSIKAKNYGKATITIRSASNRAVKKRISVEVVGKGSYRKAEAVVNMTTIRKFKAREDLKFKAKVFPKNASNMNLRWKSSDPKIISVDAHGKAHAWKEGTVKITCWAVAEPEVRSVATFKALPAERVTILNASTGVVTLVKGTQYKIGVDSSQKPICLSLNKSVATVNSKGLVKAKDYGKASIWVTSRKLDLTDSITVKVVKKSAYTGAKRVKIKGAKSIVKGESRYFTGQAYPKSVSNKNLRWYSSNKSIATVTKSGRRVKVVAKKPGTANIYCYSASEPKAKGKYTVKVLAAFGVSGTCRWTVDANGLLTISPIDGKSGVLKETAVTLHGGIKMQGFPWCDEDISRKVKSAKICSGVSGSDIEGLFNHCYRLKSVSFPSSFDTSKAKSMNSMFLGCGLLQSVSFPASFNTSNVEGMSCLFAGCKSLKSVKLPASFNTAKVKTMDSMFFDCKSLQSVSFPAAFSTAKVEDMSSMFSGCKALKSISLPATFDTSRVTDMGSMFEDCTSLASVTLPEAFKTSRLIIMSSMFAGCSSLKTISPESVVWDFDTSNVQYMDRTFAGCSKLFLSCRMWNVDKVIDHQGFDDNAPEVYGPPFGR